MWVRGLKRGNVRQTEPDRQSHPMWVRGLKLFCPFGKSGPFNVAPYVGAWIETNVATRRGGLFCVAPYVGAWIETTMYL